MIKLAITAASGKLGAEIARAAIAQVGRDAVVGLARTPKNADGLGIEVRPGDYNEPEQLASSLEGIDAVLLVSGMDAPDKRIGQHRNVIYAARSAGVRRIVYTSIQGLEEGSAFSPVVQSNRQTETDVRESGLEWVIGRNGLYIEPDVDYIETYRAQGEIANCAGTGRCGYTTRPELAYAYTQMLIDDKHVRQTYRLHGELLTQRQLAEHLSNTFGTPLSYREMSVDAYRQERVAELGPFIGGVIAGIYEGIALGALDHPSDYEAAAGRPHERWETFFGRLRDAAS